MTSYLVFDLVLAVPPALIRVGLRNSDRGTPAHVLKRIRVVEGWRLAGNASTLGLSFVRIISKLFGE